MSAQLEETIQIVVPGIPNELDRRIKKLAKRESRSRAAQIRVMLEERVTARELELGMISKAA